MLRVNQEGRKVIQSINKPSRITLVKERRCKWLKERYSFLCLFIHGGGQSMSEY